PSAGVMLSNRTRILVLLIASVVRPISGEASTTKSRIVSREPIVLHVIAGGTSTSTAAMVRIATRAIEVRTDLSLRTPASLGLDPARLTGCGDVDRYSCWVRSVRPDYDRSLLELPNGTVRPFREHS